MEQAKYYIKYYVVKREIYYDRIKCYKRNF